jgi:signal transduction histidine kinase
MAPFLHEQALRGFGETYGLFSIRERLHQLGGLIEIDSRLGEGTRVTVVSPSCIAHDRRSEDLA